jgi:hypothetical protein
MKKWWRITEEAAANLGKVLQVLELHDSLRLYEIHGFSARRNNS